ncbi:hypothetical protein B0O80DRAFT_385826 [Mortierella sp. GBAus27b]|nr:hypothetical protein B0O80DRAFT_385826 [Mortierella sp. GBAus27b]
MPNPRASTSSSNLTLVQENSEQANTGVSTGTSASTTTSGTVAPAPSSVFNNSTRHAHHASVSTIASAKTVTPSTRHHTHRSHHSSSSHHASGSRAGTVGHSSSRKHRNKIENQSTAAPRPSTTVAPAPTPAMHWSRARVHGQIPPKELRAQTVNLVGESVYIFGGCDTKNCFNTLYIFDADTMHWSQPKTYGSIPPPCRAHSSTLVDNKRLYVFGGGDGPHYFNELYMLDTGTLSTYSFNVAHDIWNYFFTLSRGYSDTLTWSNPQTFGDKPCRRRAHTTCVYNNCIYVFGGGDGVQALNDTYKLDLSDMRWEMVKTTGQAPIARGYHTSNLIKSQFIVYGGSDGHECFSDVHVLDLDTREWVKIDVNRALPRLSHTSTQVGSYLFVIGGHDGSRYSCDVVMLNLVTWSWETRKIYGIPPAGRGYHATLLYDSRLFVFGGFDGQTVFDDIYILDLSTCAYLPQITDFQVRKEGVWD